MKHLVLVVAVLAGCSKDKKEEPKAEPKAVEERRELPPPTRELEKKTTAAAFGKKPAATFGKIEKAKLGMSEADAKAALPELFAGTLVDAEHRLSFKPVVEWGKLWRIEVHSDSFGRMEELVAEAWGPGEKRKGTLHGSEVTYWFDPATNTRAIADSSDLLLQYYVPLDQLLGEPGKPEIAALPKPVLGITADELKANYAGQMKPDDKLLHIILPPTEYERDHVSVFVMHSDRKKKTTDYSLQLTWAADFKTVKPAILEAFKKKWGEPKLAKSYGSDDDSYVFHKKNPLIEAKPWDHDKSWHLSVRPKDDACGGPCYKGL